MDLLPAVTHIALDAVVAARAIIKDHVLHIPVDARSGSIRVIGWVSPIVLQVMSIYTFRFIMFSQVKGTELSFIMENVEIVIKFIVVDQRYPDLFLVVGERTEFAILAFVNIIRVV